MSRLRNGNFRKLRIVWMPKPGSDQNCRRLVHWSYTALLLPLCPYRLLILVWK